MADKTRYSDEELEEFRNIINEKLALARRDYNEMMRQLKNADGNDVDDTSPTYKALEEGSVTQSKEEIVQLASRQQKFIQGLEAALIRIKNKTYGIDRITGELIPKERDATRIPLLDEAITINHMIRSCSTLGVPRITST